MKCNLCPRRCNAERTDFENNGGFCKAPMLPKIARAGLHFWEEPCISGRNGSGTVFFSGCSLNCVYCQNFDVSRGIVGKTVSYERLAEIFRELEEKGAHNINLVTPTHYVHAIKRALDIYRPKIPIVYNSGGYDSVNTIKSLKDYVDIYLMDFKYKSCEKSEKYSSADDYPQVAEEAILEAYSQAGECKLNSDGIMQKGLIIRHLLMPQGTNQAIEVFNWVRKNTPNAHFSIMSQFTPLANLRDYPEINRKITKREYEKVLDVICESGFENCFFQSIDSSDKKYIPSFDLEGV
ncbi:MAG: radical SAM protein [Clostridia bacterium]|nr:radical SAM protein [Clostridia bacterium]